MRCGLGQQDGSGFERLREVSVGLDEIGSKIGDLVSEQRRLIAERDQLLAVFARRALHAPATIRPTKRVEWRPERVRDVLLWLGAFLVGVAAVAFSVVAWSRAGQIGRASLLAGVTVTAAAGATLARRRLPASAEVLGVLALSLVLVDWFALRRAGVSAGHAMVVWSVWGTALDAALAVIAGRWLRAARVAAVLAAMATGVLVAVAVTAAPWALGAGLAVVAGVGATSACLLARVSAWRPAAVILGALSAGLDLVALGVLPAAARITAVGDAFGPAAALAVTAMAPVAFRSVLVDLSRRVGHVLVAVTAAALLGSVVVLLAGSFSGTALLAAAALVFAIGVVISRLLASALRPGVAVVSGLATALTAAGLLGSVAVAMFGPWSWAGAAWSTTGQIKGLTHLGPLANTLPDAKPAAVAMAAVALAAIAAVVRLRPQPLVSARLALGAVLLALLAEVALLPVLAGLAIVGVVAVQVTVAVVSTGAAVFLDRRGRTEWLGFALLGGGAAVPAGGWAVASRTTTLAALAATATAAAVGTALARRSGIRAALGAVAGAAVLAEVGTATVAAGGSGGPAGLAVALAAAAVLTVGVWARRAAPEGWTLETVALAALAAAPFVASTQPAWRAGALTVAVPTLAVAGVRPDRRGYRWVGAVVAVGATWAWLGIAHVTLIEAYYLPAAAAAICAGSIARHGDPGVGSWRAYGTGLVFGFSPSLLVVLGRGGLARPLLLTAVALATVITGVRRQLRAPVTVGAVALVVLALDTLGPVGDRLPRWATVGAAGLLLLFLGVSVERRLSQLRHLRGRYHDFN